MGLFDFIKDLGHHAEDDAKVQGLLNDEIKKVGLSIQNFQVQFSKGLATISGVATSVKDQELARLIIGNHRSVNKVNDDGLTVAAYPAGVTTPQTPLVLAPQQGATAQQAPASAQAPGQMVTVKSGDTLSKIAKQYLGNANRYSEIFEANRPMLKDPDAIYPGQVIRIPKELTAH